MKIVSHNVNGIRSVLRKGYANWVRTVNADILCLQELKAGSEQFDRKAFRKLGYHSYVFPAGKKGYSGVAVLSKEEATEIEEGWGLRKFDSEGRFLRVTFKKYNVINTYMPSGASSPARQAYKLDWLDAFLQNIFGLNTGDTRLVICGDFNLCHRPIDIHNPLVLDGFPGFTLEEREWMTTLLDSGFVDCFRKFNTLPHNYTWWSYQSGARMRNVGWRIDYILANSLLNAQILNCRHLSEVSFSDHCPVIAEFDILSDYQTMNV